MIPSAEKRRLGGALVLSVALHGFLLPLAAGDGSLLPTSGTASQPGPLTAVLRDGQAEPQQVPEAATPAPPMVEEPIPEAQQSTEAAQPTISTRASEAAPKPPRGGKSGKFWAAWPRLDADGQPYPLDAIAFTEGDPSRSARVKMEIFVSWEGAVVEAVVVDSSLSAEETETLRRRILATPFHPAIDGGKRVDIRTDFEITRSPIPTVMRQGR